MILGMMIPVWIDDVVRKSPIKGNGLTLEVILLTGLCMAIGVLVLHLSKSTILTITPEELSRTISILGQQIRKRSRQNCELCGLRKNPLVSEWSGRDMANRNVVEVSWNGSYQTLAYGLTDAEADALIARMMEVYPFPEDRLGQSEARVVAR
jgi:hypothetical protein